MTTKAEYELLEEVGRGPAGTVYRAHDMALKRDVAIKELAEPIRKDARQLRRVLDGARFLAGFSHDHLVQVHGLDEGRGWVIMELMRGGLDARAAEGPLPADLTRSVLRQALEGLQFLHRQGRLHGAIKPANLLINAEGRVKLSDAACLDAQGEVRKPSDNAKYLTPELIDPSFGEVGPGTDLYCLGLTALELLKGPGFDAFFHGAGAANPQMTWLRLHGSPSEGLPSARDLVPGVPADLCRVIDRLLAKKVSERYASAADALADLDEGEVLPVAVATPANPKPVVPPAAPPLRQAVSAPPSPGKSSPAASPARPGQGPKPWSKDWLNHKLSDRRVLYPLLGTIIVGTVVFFFWPEAEAATLGRVKVGSEPPGAAVFIDGEKQEQQTEAKLRLLPGKHHLRLELAGYEPAEEDFEIRADGPAQKLHKQLRKEADPAPPPPSPKLPPEKKDTKAPSPVREPAPPARRVTSSIGMELVLIPAGTFPMGAAADEVGAARNERPRHEVTLSRPFYMGVHEVTQEQYEKVMGHNPARLSQENGGGPRHPVENVSWQDAVEFCRRLSELPKEKRAGRSYRLPTESEWEYACRAGTTTPFHAGSSLSSAEACFQGSSPGGDGEKGEDALRTAPVGSYPANAWGLHDMHGNVWEWCADWYSADAYARSAEQDPQGPREGEGRVVRGGSWQSPGRDCRSARRLKMAPDLLNVGIGFRVVMVLAGQE